MKTLPKKTQDRGFALIVTLSLMILLTVVAVGLLTLSSISLRSSGQGSAMSVARANARMALMLAIGDLQKSAGPDKRITAPANLKNPTFAPGITGVWKSWNQQVGDLNYDGAKTGSNFLGYLMSNPRPDTLPDPAALPQESATAKVKNLRLVGPKSVTTVPAGVGEITAPMVEIAGAKGNVASGGVAWVTLDEGVKGRIDLAPAADPAALGERITQVGSAARNGFEAVDTKMSFLNDENAKLLISLPKLATLDSANLAAGSKGAVSQYFHDFTVASNSVQVDVRRGGLKTDLSVLFDGTYGSNLPSDYSSKYLYSDTATPYQGAATTSDIQWGLYANYMRLYRRSVAELVAALPTGYTVKSIADKTLGKARFEPDMSRVKQPMLMPTVVRVDTVFSLVARPVHGHRIGKNDPKYPYLLHLMYLPVITLHNPYNAPLKVTNLQVEFADFPVGFEFLVNGQPAVTGGLQAMNDLYTDYKNIRGNKKTINLTLSNSLSGATEVLMGAGETRIFGTPFAPTTTFGSEVENGADGVTMFDWEMNKTQTLKTIPGMITGPNDGVGFDLDTLGFGTRLPWMAARDTKNAFGGLILLAPDDNIQVKFAPKVPTSSGNLFSITLKMGNSAVGTTQVFYLNQARLDEVMKEGTSPRFPEARNFPTPEVYPRVGMTPIKTTSILEDNAKAVSKYVKAKPFAIFSVGGKTTEESFTKSRPVADTGIAFQMATCDFTTSASQGASPLEFALVPVKSDGKALESGGIKDSKGTSLQGFFFGGHGSDRGTTSATIYEVPKAPLQSIAQLRHANAGSIGSFPYSTYTVGEARAHPGVPSNSAFSVKDSSKTNLDHSWLANDQLWDRYWFSTLATLRGVAYSGSSAMDLKDLASEFFAGKRKLPNNRNIPYIPAGKKPSEVAIAAATATGKLSATSMMTAGGFNVNSTSVPAWISVLSSLVKTDVPLASGVTETDPSGTPFLRVRQPKNAFNSTIEAKEKLWNSYRTLNDTEIKSLATQIVAEIRTRGPFLSMAEFVNRRLGVSADPLAREGAIQAALGRTAINTVPDSMAYNSVPVSPSEVSGFGWKNSDAAVGNTGAGAPGEISQGDVLSAIGSFATVRSDTFRIRAFGDARNAAGQVIARVWCEANVQRLPEYVDGADLPEAIPSSIANTNFGRQFKVTAFRWLHPDEI